MQHHKKVISFSTINPEADFYAENIKFVKDGIKAIYEAEEAEKRRKEEEEARRKAEEEKAKAAEEGSTEAGEDSSKEEIGTEVEPDNPPKENDSVSE